MAKLKVIEDPVHNNIPFTSVESYVLSSRTFNRLHNIHQNSFAYFVFPAIKASMVKEKEV